MKSARVTQTMRRMKNARMTPDAPIAHGAPKFLRGGVSLFFIP